MNATTAATTATKAPELALIPHSPNVWAQGWRRLRANRVGMVSLYVSLAFLLLIVLSLTGLVAKDWQREVGVSFAPPHFVGAIDDGMQSTKIEGSSGTNVDISDIDPLAPRYAEWSERASRYTTTVSVQASTLPFGADQLGRDVVSKVIKGAQVSVTVGVIAALLATLIGTVLGALAGYWGGVVDDVLEWFYNVITSIPYILLVFSLAAVLRSGPFAAVFSGGIWMLVIILGCVGWTGIYRQVRAEYIKHRAREYVRAAEAIGASHASRMFTHILPNISHVILVQLSLHVVAFIKSEVILSYLGFGVPIDMVSWGTMLAETQYELVQGKWWQLVAATTMMATFVTAFALLTDALRDALDPKLR